MIHLPFAYIGPGAGFAFLGSFFALLLSLLASLASFLLWPLRMLRGALRHSRGMRAARVRRSILLCMDGLDAAVTERLMAEGKLPYLAGLKEQGAYRRLRGAEWFAWATGVRVDSAVHEPFWKTLGRHSVSSTILRVPALLPPDKFDGRMLAADASAERRRFSSFTTGNLTNVDGSLEGSLAEGLKFRIKDPRGSPCLEIANETHTLNPHVFTPWIRVKPGGVRGIVRFLLTGTGEEFSLYASAVEPDPEHPEAPISHPRRYSVYLAKLLGPFATSPVVGDEAALRAGAIEAEDFLMQVKLAQEERKAMFFSAIEHQPSGMVVCGFDAPRRIQQVFAEYEEVIEWAYREMDRLVGRTLECVKTGECAKTGTAVFVFSDNVLFANRKLDAETPNLEDIAPTVLALFGVEPPTWMDGRPVIRFA